MKFHGFDGLDGDTQREKMRGWGPSPHCVVETVLFRHRDDGEREYLVCRRLNGALSVANPPACTTSNFGHHHLVAKDDDIPATALRAIGEKLGYRLTRARLTPVAVCGTALNTSTLARKGKTLRLTINDHPAEPSMPFVAHLFAGDCTSIRQDERGNGSLEMIGWYILPELVKRFGNSRHHIYHQFLFHAVRRISQIAAASLQGLYPTWEPGAYEFVLH